MPPVFPLALPLLWLVRALALGSSLVAGWLTLIKWINPRVSLAGCGGSEGCTTLLDSRWSNWFSIPVTLIATSLWVAVLLLTLPAANRWLGRTANQLLSACALLLIAGALWFGTLMVAVEKVWCPWCAALHLAALGAGGILLVASWKASRQGEAGLLCAAGQAGVAGAALLILGQLFGKLPDTHRLTAESPPPIVTPALPSAGSISFLAGSLVFRRNEVPLMGSADAPHVFAGFSDYTCTACRSLHSDLKALMKSAPGTYAVLILPTPLDPACNPHLTAPASPGVPSKHTGACELARIALAFWKAAPGQFEALHDYLMAAPLPLDPGTALTEAARLAPGIRLEVESGWIAAQLSENIESWRLLSSDNNKLPKLVLRDDVVLHGSTANRARFFEIIEQNFPPAPVESIPVSILPPGKR